MIDDGSKSVASGNLEGSASFEPLKLFEVLEILGVSDPFGDLASFEPFEPFEPLEERRDEGDGYGAARTPELRRAALGMLMVVSVVQFRLDMCSGAAGC